MKNKEMAEKWNIDVKAFKYADLLTCEWFVFVNKLSTIYFTDNINPCRYCRETKLSYTLRKMGLKKYITFGKPKTIKSIAPHEPITFKEKEMPNYRIRFAKTEKNSRDENTQNQG